MSLIGGRFWSFESGWFWSNCIKVIKLLVSLLQKDLTCWKIWIFPFLVILVLPIPLFHIFPSHSNSSPTKQQQIFRRFQYFFLVHFISVTVQTCFSIKLSFNFDKWVINEGSMDNFEDVYHLSVNNVTNKQLTIVSLMKFDFTTTFLRICQQNQ